MMTSRHFSIYFGAFVGPLGGLAVLALFPVLKHDFGVGIEEIQLSIPYFMLPFAFFQLFSGTISDRIGRGGILTSGFFIYGIGSLLCAMAQGLDLFLWGRLIQGIGFALVSPVLGALLGDITDPPQMGTAMGIFGSAITLGIATGPLIAGFMEAFQWRWTFIIFAILSIMVVLVTSASFGKGFLGFREVRRGGRSSSIWSVVGDREVILLCGAGFLAFFAFIGPQTYMADRYSSVFDAKEIGYILSSTGFAGIFWSPVAGRLVDRMGTKVVGVNGFAIVTVALLVLAHANTLVSFILIFCIIGIGTATIWASLMTLMVEIVPGSKGTVSSVFNSVRFFGYALAPPLLLGIYLNYGVIMVYLLGSSSCVGGVIMLRAMNVGERRSRRGGASRKGP